MIFKNKISVVVFTNENYYNLLELTLPFLIKSFEYFKIDIIVVSNKITNPFPFTGITQIDCNVNFSGSGNHFEKSMTYALNLIKSDYILFLCDDYLVNSPIKKNVFEGIINLIYDNSIDFLSLGSQKYVDSFISKWNKLDVDYEKYGIPKDCLFYTDEKYRHLYSVQPCIWKKESLLKILKYNPDMSMRDLDNTNIKDLNGNYRNLDYTTNFYLHDENFLNYNFKNLCIYYPESSFNIDDKPIGSDYFLLDYGEIVRHGKFLDKTVNSGKILEDILNQKLELKNKLLNFQ